MPMTLEQQRAAHAWACCDGAPEAYAKLAKSVPALIMNSGLIQVLAVLQEKAGDTPERPHGKLAAHLRDWLAKRFPERLPAADFATVVEGLMEAEPREFQAITAEALAWLRWLRQIAPARANAGTQRSEVT